MGKGGGIKKAGNEVEGIKEEETPRWGLSTTEGTCPPVLDRGVSQGGNVEVEQWIGGDVKVWDPRCRQVTADGNAGWLFLFVLIIPATLP